MCGRFALGLAADDIAYHVNHDYFQQQHDRDEAGGGADENDDNEEDVDGAGESGQGANRSQQGDSSGTTGQTSSGDAQAGAQERQGGDEGLVAWGNQEAKAGHRVCPKSKSVVMRKGKRAGLGSEKYELDALVWGLVPHWYKTPPTTPISTINAQCESVFEGKPSWRGPRENKRCVVLAQGFYEWLQKGKDKVPHFVKRKDGKLMAFAGLWDHCEYNGDYDSITSYTILTTPVNAQLRFLHTRMPAILASFEEIQLWLSDSPWNDGVKALIRPYESQVECYPVDQGVGKVGNESPDFIKPVAAKKGSLDALFAKQKSASSPSKPSSSTNPKPSSASPSSILEQKVKAQSSSPSSPSASTSKPKTKTMKEEENEDETMNPDEDSPRKVAVIAKAEDKLEGRQSSTPKKCKAPNSANEVSKAKVKRGGSEGVEEVEVLDLSADSSGEDDDATMRKPAKKKARKEKAQLHTDGKGNEELTDFFPVVDEEK
ncbi:hypothetical protein JCM11641_005839 [Rhodosporidiobolus odoratus]